MSCIYNIREKLEKMNNKTHKSIRFNRMTRSGNPLMWHLEIVIPNYGGRKCNNGKPSVRTKFVLDYMAALFAAIDQAVADVGGLTKNYREFKE